MEIPEWSEYRLMLDNTLFKSIRDDSEDWTRCHKIVIEPLSIFRMLGHVVQINQGNRCLVQLNTLLNKVPFILIDPVCFPHLRRQPAKIDRERQFSQSSNPKLPRFSVGILVQQVLSPHGVTHAHTPPAFTNTTTSAPARATPNNKIRQSKVKSRQKA